MEIKRIVTHTDLDGVVSAFLISFIFDCQNFYYAEPLEIQERSVKCVGTDVVVDLPLPPNSVALWFDHHDSNKTDKKFNGKHENKKSCARVIFDYYLKEHPEIAKFRELIDETDKQDSADITPEEYLNPGAAGIISISIKSRSIREDNDFRNFLINSLFYMDYKNLAANQIVQNRYKERKKEVEEWFRIIKDKIELRKKLIFLDTSEIDDAGRGNTWVLYATYPKQQLVFWIKSVNEDYDKLRIVIADNPFCADKEHIHLGNLMKEYNGGGHNGIGVCMIDRKDKDKIVKELLSKIL
ncbi:DHH family phosphoesterase [Candidatus Woesearchaeota archaeon]|nr:DHH family phosphoesterase [Candidatus Woesearchaeota archaeon]